MKYNPMLFKTLSKYLKETKANWCILGATERDNKWYMFLYDTITHKRRSLTYLLNLMIEHRLFTEIFTQKELDNLRKCLPHSFAEKFAV